MIGQDVKKRSRTYLLRNVPMATYRLFQSRCAIEGKKIRHVLIKFMEEYGENGWYLYRPISFIR